MDTDLKRLSDIGFRTNLRKSFFMQQEVEYLGFLLTSDGIKLQPKKVEAMKRIKPSTNSKQLKRFFGMIKFYGDVWDEKSRILAPLCNLTSKTGKLN